ncbi:MAG: DUF3306 domain-containing protein [Geminicoccales bacterium]
MAGHKPRGGDLEPSATSPEDEGFLGRWSRRKASTKTTAAVEHISPPTDLVDDKKLPTAVEGEPDDQQPTEKAFDPATLPDIDKMGPGSDFSVFMQSGVPSALKTKALRKLWLVKPELANLDGLIDYGEDLTGSFKVVDQLKTAYQVGKGFLKDDEEQEPPDETVIADDDAADDHDAVADITDDGAPKEKNLAADHPNVRDQGGLSRIKETNGGKG